MRGGGINATTSRRTRDNRGGGKRDGDGDGECRAPPSRDCPEHLVALGNSITFV